MLFLVLTHGDVVGLVEQDVGGHEAGIGEEAAVDVVGVFGGLVLELGHTGKLAEHGIAVQHPAQLGVGGDVGLDEDGTLLRVQAAGDILGHLSEHPAAQLGRVLAHRDGVQVGHEEIAVKFLNHLRPVADRAQVVAQVQLPAGLDAGEHYFLFIHGVVAPLFSERPGGAPV